MARVMKTRILFPDIEDREEWHEADRAMHETLNQEKPLLKSVTYDDAPSEMAIGWVGHRGENRAQRRKAVALFKEPEPGLRRKLWQQRQKLRRGIMRKKGE